MRNVASSSGWASLPVIATVARLLCKDLTLQNEYLRAENKVLKSKIKGRIIFTDEDRRSLAGTALAMGRKLMLEVVSIVKPETILAWQRRPEKEKWDYSYRKKRTPGRPRTPGDIEAVICRLARENIWGYMRIQGELLKLDIKLSKGCIADILRCHNLPPSPERKGLTWREFLARHADVTVCGDFFTKEVWSFCGLKRAYVLFVMHMKTRQILLAEATFCPHSRWMSQMARNLLMQCEDQDVEARFVLHDRDALFPHDFDRVMEAAGIRVIKSPFHAPNANAHAERWVRSVKRECLDHLILFGLENLRRAVSTYRDFHNEHRPHQGLRQSLPTEVAQSSTRGCPVDGKLSLPPSDVVCTPFLGGLLKSYSRKAA